MIQSVYKTVNAIEENKVGWGCRVSGLGLREERFHIILQHFMKIQMYSNVSRILP